MRKYIVVVIVIALILLLGFFIYINNQKLSKELNVSKITIQFKDNSITSSGATIIYTDMNKPPYGYEEWYKIEKKESNQWKSLEPISKEYFFKDMAWKLDRNGSIEKYINWSFIYGDLESGQYRLVKRIYDNEYKFIYAEFQIN